MASQDERLHRAGDELRFFLESLVPARKAELAEKAAEALGEEGIDQIGELRRFSYSELRQMGVPGLLAKGLCDFFAKEETQAQASADRLSYFDSDAYRRVKHSTPSYLALNSPEFTIGNQMEKPPVFLNYRPDTARGLPLPLVSPVFGKFIDMCRETEVHKRDSAFVHEFCQESSKAYTGEHDRCLMLIKLLKKYMPVDFVIICCDNMDMAIFYGERLVAFIEVKNEQGRSGDPFIQACRYYLQNLVGNLDDEMVQRGCYPVFLVEVVGPLLRISGAAFTDAPVVEPLRMGLLVRRSDESEMATLCRMVVAFRKSLEELALSTPPYEVELDLKQAKLPHVLRELHLRGASIEPIIHGETYVLHLQGLGGQEQEEEPDYIVAFRRIQARGIRKAFVKFSQRYGSEVHRDWFQRGCAPELFDTVTLGGGWLMVCMEYMDKYIDLDKASNVFRSNWHEVEGLARKCLAQAQQSALRGVHGDLRLPNLMVDLELTRVIAVDFGWAGIDGIDRYPYYMNHADVAWPDGANDGAVLRREHDRELLSSQLALKTNGKRYRYRWDEELITLKKPTTASAAAAD